MDGDERLHDLEDEIHQQVSARIEVEMEMGRRITNHIQAGFPPLLL